ncbi:MAG: hypothetical protein MJ246_00620 [Clostridia bacterium]|nr:hypothetical protein [Clostridia bacterium]
MNLFISGNIQIYEMIILGLITFLRLTRLKKDKKHFDKEIKYETAAIIASTVITSLLAFIPAFYREGRFEGTIYYANACAMFLLAGIALLYNYKFDEKKKMHNILR